MGDVALLENLGYHQRGGGSGDGEGGEVGGEILTQNLGHHKGFAPFLLDVGDLPLHPLKPAGCCAEGPPGRAEGLPGRGIGALTLDVFAQNLDGCAAC